MVSLSRLMLNKASSFCCLWQSLRETVFVALRSGMAVIFGINQEPKMEINSMLCAPAVVYINGKFYALCWLCCIVMVIMVALRPSSKHPESKKETRAVSSCRSRTKGSKQIPLLTK
jgi:hypothetical protein